MIRPRVASDSGLSSDSCDETLGGDFCRDHIQHLGRFCIHDRIKYYEKQLNDIKGAKLEFAKNFLAINQRIETITRTIRAFAQARERNLKVSLQSISRAKISEWERQAKVCRNAVEALDRSRRGTVTDLQDICNAYARSIGLVHSGEIEFVSDVAPLLRQLDVSGEFFVGDESAETLSDKPMPQLIIGGFGEKIGEFRRPWGVCTDAAGRILVADRGNNRIQVFNEYGVFQFQFGELGTGPGQFYRPAGITVDSKSRIIVSDKDNHRVQVFSFNGLFIFSFGQKGTKPGMFQYPWDVAVDGDGNIAVSDTQNRRIQLFNDCGVFITKYDFCIGINGLRKRVSPRGVVFRSDDTLLVTDFNNHCILLIRHGFTGATKWRGHQNVLRPQGIACDGHGTVAVVDSKKNRIQLSDECGNLLRSFGRKGNNPGEFNCLQDVCFLINGNIAVTEFGSNRVQIF